MSKKENICSYVPLSKNKICLTINHYKHDQERHLENDYPTPDQHPDGHRHDAGHGELRGLSRYFLQKKRFLRRSLGINPYLCGVFYKYKNQTRR